MDKKELLSKIAPCSLMCHTCTAYGNGVINSLSNELLKYLDGLSEFYEKHWEEKTEPHKIFLQELNQYACGPCGGCRSQGHNKCSIEGCFILKCVTEHGVDYCGECRDFPCDKTKSLFEDVVYSQWLEGNSEIKDLGIEKFWENNKEKPHYKAYKNSCAK